MSAPFAVPMQGYAMESSGSNPMMGAALVALLVSAGWLLVSPGWTKSATAAGVFGTGQSWLTMIIVFVIAGVLGFYGLKWWEGRS